jgi:hypothetical protein
MNVFSLPSKRQFPLMGTDGLYLPKKRRFNMTKMGVAKPAKNHASSGFFKKSYRTLVPFV